MKTQYLNETIIFQKNYVFISNLNLTEQNSVPVK
jgi:hypothetical protein